MRDGSDISFVLRWDYHFAFSSENVSGFRIFRRMDGEDHGLLDTVAKAGVQKATTAYQESPNESIYSYTDSDVQPGKAYSYKVVAFDPAGNEAFNEVRIRTDPAADPVAGPENVLVVVNRSSPQSVEIGRYYQSQRGVPKQNVLSLPYSGNAVIISLKNFELKISGPIRDYLIARGLREKVLYIVVTYGLPYKISVRQGKGADSVDAYLTDLFDEYRNDPNFEIGGPSARYRNPYYLAGSHFSRANGNRGYLVARLDGPLAQPTDARYNKDTLHPNDPLQYLKNMVDYALWAEQHAKQLSGKGYFDRRFNAPWSTPEGKGDLFINGAYDVSVNLGLKSLLDTNPQLFGIPPADSGGEDPLVCDNALWYAGWYSHFYKDAFEWQKGAVGFHLESWTAMELRNESRFRGRSGWLWVPGMIRDGITATMGAVHEPGLGGVPRINWFFRYFLHGFSFGEAVYMANYGADGQTVIIGDPLYNPFPNKRLDRTCPKITISSPTPGQTVRGTKVLVEGTVDDPHISMLDSCHPVRDARFAYTQAIGSTKTTEADLPLIVRATDTSGNRTSAAVSVHWMNNPPRLDPVRPMETREGKTLTFEFKASDADKDDLRYFFAVDSARPKGASLNQRSGRFEWKPGFDQAGTYTFQFQVTDGFASDRKEVTVVVRQAGSHPPKFISPPKKLTGRAGRMLYHQFEAEDIDGDTIFFSAAESLPPGARIIQVPPRHAVLLWEPQPDQVGLHTINFKVSDGKGGEDTVAVEIEITPSAPRQSP